MNLKGIDNSSSTNNTPVVPPTTPAAPVAPPTPDSATSAIANVSGVSGGALDELDDVSGKSSVLGKIFKAPFSLIGKVLEVGVTILSAGAFGVLGVIFFVLKIICGLLYYLFLVILPFVIMWIGVPMFVLGAIMGLFFLGGHILFVVVFIVGIIYYVKSTIAIVYQLPNNSKKNKVKK